MALCEENVFGGEFEAAEGCFCKYLNGARRWVVEEVVETGFARIEWVECTG